jgi:uncharacterized protein YjbJ (UPF0337 family)
VAEHESTTDKIAAKAEDALDGAKDLAADATEAVDEKHGEGTSDSLLGRAANAVSDAADKAGHAVDDVSGAGTTDSVVGKVKDVAGDVTGDDGLKAEGKVQQGAGDVKATAEAVGEKADELAGAAKHAAADATEQVKASVTQLQTAVQDNPKDTQRYAVVAAAVVGLLLLVRALRNR